MANVIPNDDSIASSDALGLGLSGDDESLNNSVLALDIVDPNSRGEVQDKALPETWLLQDEMATRLISQVLAMN